MIQNIKNIKKNLMNGKHGLNMNIKGILLNIKLGKDAVGKYTEK
jgi:hypothetical protein